MLSNSSIGVLFIVVVFAFGCIEDQGPGRLLPSKTALEFGTTKSQETFSLINNREADKSWSLEATEPWVLFSPASGVVAGRSVLEVSVMIDRLGLHPGIYSFTIKLLSDGTTHEIPCSMRIPTAFNKIVFSTGRNHDGTNDIYAMDMDGTNEQPLVTWPSDEIQPSISPDGKEVVFVSNKDQMAYNLYKMNIDGSSVVQLTFGDLLNQSRFPRWSPDGKKIVYTFDNGGLKSQIFVMDKDGTNIVQVTIEETGAKSQPDWAPDGQSLVYVSTEASIASDLYLIEVAGTNKIRLTNSIYSFEYGPVFSPDGEKIFFTRALNGLRQLFEINTDGTNEKQQTNSTISLQFPKPGEDGRFIFTAFNNETDTTLLDSEVYVIDTAGQKQLTDYTNRWTHQFADW